MDIEAKIWIRKPASVRDFEIIHRDVHNYLNYITSKNPDWVELVIVNQPNASFAFYIDNEHLYSVQNGAKFQLLLNSLTLYHNQWGRVTFYRRKFKAVPYDQIVKGMLIRGTTDNSQYIYVDSTGLNASGFKVLNCIQEGDNVNLDSKKCEKYKMTVLIENLDRNEFELINWAEKK